MYQNIQQILKYQDAEIFTYDCDSIIFKFNDSIPIPLQEHDHIFGYFKSEIPKGYFFFLHFDFRQYSKNGKKAHVFFHF